MKHDEGFTLIELLVSIAAASLVSAAAVSLLLLGLRFQSGVSAQAEEQQSVRIVLSMLEEMAANGQIGAVAATDRGWQLLAADDPNRTLFTYAAPEQTLYTGEAADGAPLLTGLHNAAVTMDGQLMQLSFETKGGGRYCTRVYCRNGEAIALAVPGEVLRHLADRREALDSAGLPEEDPAYRRLAFLETLAAEYVNGANGGEIQHPIPGQPYRYYTEWYIRDGWGQNGWGRDTPWCACFLSWAAVKSGAPTEAHFLCFADVDAGMEAFRQTEGWHGADPGYEPQPGDYVFFDWSGRREDPAHVGAVLEVADGQVYTIEGNSGGGVAVRVYPLDEGDILGYGVLPAFVP